MGATTAVIELQKYAKKTVKLYMTTTTMAEVKCRWKKL